MARKTISQTAAYAYKARAEELERQRRDERLAWGRRYPPGSVEMGSVEVAKAGSFYGRLDASQMLGRVLIAKLDGERLHIHAAP